MKRFALSIGMLVFMVQLTGCSNAPPPADGSNQPDEVKEYEARREAERAKKGATKAP